MMIDSQLGNEQAIEFADPCTTTADLSTEINRLNCTKELTVELSFPLSNLGLCLELLLSSSTVGYYIEFS